MKLPPLSVAFCATGRGGPGALRRVTSVARELSALEPGLPLSLVCSESPDELSDAERSLFAVVEVCEHRLLSSAVASARAVIVDTAQLLGLEHTLARTGLILRETPADRVAGFALPERPWDLLLIPNPPGHWLPAARDIPARHYHAVGWIFGRTQPAVPVRPSHNTRRVLVDAGSVTDRGALPSLGKLAGLLSALRCATGFPLEIEQIVGSRAGAPALIPGCDRRVRGKPPFARADLVISTGGYDSTLELAGTDVPVLFVPVECAYDDMRLRAERWAPRLGAVLDRGSDPAVVDWMVQTLAARRRRRRVDLGNSGAELAAELIQEHLL